MVSVRLSVPSIDRYSSVRRVCCCGQDIDRLLHGLRPAATAPQQHGGQQQMRAVSR